jgi:hypothetical protein
MNRIQPLLVVLVTLAVGSRLAAQPTVVLGPGDVRLPGAGGPAPADPDQAAFLRDAGADAVWQAPFDADLPLINPPAWGRVVSAATTGHVQIRRTFARGLILRIDLAHLLAAHRYILCINDRPNHPGNEFLPSAVPGSPDEKYYDFQIVPTDDQGRYHGDFAIRLHPGPYNIRFYVKDTADFKIVLYHDYFDIAVTGP